MNLLLKSFAFFEFQTLKNDILAYDKSCHDPHLPIEMLCLGNPLQLWISKCLIAPAKSNGFPKDLT